MSGTGSEEVSRRLQAQEESMAQLEDPSEMSKALQDGMHILDKNHVVTVDGLYCPRCRGRRRMQARLLYKDGDAITSRSIMAAGKGSHDDGSGVLAPSSFRLSCVQCLVSTTVVFWKGPAGRQMALLRETMGGLSSPNTAPAVSFYLDQVARCESVGAATAALTMYRAALEQLLFEQGYQDGMLHAKISALMAAKAAGNAPKWAAELDEADLRVINRLGNGAIHPNGGDISKQDVIDGDLLVAVSMTFEALVELVYERPRAEERRRQRLQAAAERLR